MTSDSPFSNLAKPPSVPIIGQPTVVGAIVAITIACSCPTHPPIIGVVGALLTCKSCGANWQVGVEAKFQVQQVAPTKPSSVLTT
jgi:hypothetical protein